MLGLEPEFFGFANTVENIESVMKKVLVDNDKGNLLVSDHLLIRKESRADGSILPTEPSSDMSVQSVALPG